MQKIKNKLFVSLLIVLSGLNVGFAINEPIEIYSCHDFRHISRTSGQLNYKIMNDIDFGEDIECSKYLPIKSLQGKLYGSSYNPPTISNISIDYTRHPNKSSVIGEVHRGKLENIIFENLVINTHSSYGTAHEGAGLIGRGHYAEINNISLNNSVIRVYNNKSSKTNAIGGIIGSDSGSRLRNIHINNLEIISSINGDQVDYEIISSAGGIVGVAGGMYDTTYGTSITNSTIEYLSITGGSRLGGVVGHTTGLGKLEHIKLNRITLDAKNHKRGKKGECSDQNGKEDPYLCYGSRIGGLVGSFNVARKYGALIKSNQINNLIIQNTNNDVAALVGIAYGGLNSETELELTLLNNTVDQYYVHAKSTVSPLIGYSGVRNQVVDNTATNGQIFAYSEIGGLVGKTGGIGFEVGFPDFEVYPPMYKNNRIKKLVISHFDEPNQKITNIGGLVGYLQWVAFLYNNEVEMEIQHKNEYEIAKFGGILVRYAYNEVNEYARIINNKILLKSFHCGGLEKDFAHFIGKPRYIAENNSYVCRALPFSSFR